MIASLNNLIVFLLLIFKIIFELHYLLNLSYAIYIFFVE